MWQEHDLCFRKKGFRVKKKSLKSISILGAISLSKLIYFITFDFRRQCVWFCRCTGKKIVFYHQNIGFKNSFSWFPPLFLAEFKLFVFLLSVPSAKLPCRELLFALTMAEAGYIGPFCHRVVVLLSVMGPGCLTCSKKTTYLMMQYHNIFYGSMLTNFALNHHKFWNTAFFNKPLLFSLCCFRRAEAAFRAGGS